MKLAIQKPDTLGALASTLCVIHCFATPFIFIAHTCSAGACDTSPIWWRNLDYIFLFISFFAVARSVKVTSKSYMKPALWTSWFTLFALILNEKFKWIPLPETITYISALLLAALHIYNLKYCQCANEKCCTQNG